MPRAKGSALPEVPAGRAAPHRPDLAVFPDPRRASSRPACGASRLFGFTGCRPGLHLRRAHRAVWRRVSEACPCAQTAGSGPRSDQACWRGPPQVTSVPRDVCRAVSGASWRRRPQVEHGAPVKSQRQVGNKET